MTDAYGNDAATSTGTIADTTNDAASGAPQRAESTERLARPLIKLAKACGLATSFIDQLGTYTEISDAASVSYTHLCAAKFLRARRPPHRACR